MEQPLAQVTRSWATPLRRLQPGRSYCAGDSGGDPGHEHRGEVSEAWRFLPGPWPRVVTGCRDRGAGPRPRLPVPTPAPSGAPHRGKGGSAAPRSPGGGEVAGTSFPFPPRAACRPVPPGGAVVPPPARRGPALPPAPFSPRSPRRRAATSQPQGARWLQRPALGRWSPQPDSSLC